MDARPISDKLATSGIVRIVLRRVARNSRGATAVEYGLVVALIVLAMLGALSGVGEVTSSMWNNVNDKVTNSH